MVIGNLPPAPSMKFGKLKVEMTLAFIVAKVIGAG